MLLKNTKGSVLTLILLILLIGCQGQGKEGDNVKVTLLHTEGCLNTPPARELIVKVAGELGIAIDIEDIEISGYDNVRKYRFFGSPTVQINGLDIEREMRERTDYGAT